MLDIQQVAEHKLEQHAVILTDGEHPALGLLNMIEREVDCERQAVSADISVTKFDRPREFSIRSDQHQEGKKDAWYENDYTLRPSGSGTALSKHVTGSIGPVVFALAYLAIRKDAMTSLRNLKTTVEAKGATGGTV